MLVDENLALKLALEEQKVVRSEKAAGSPCAKDSPSYSGKVSASPSSRDTCWQVIPKSSTSCTIKKTRAPVPVSNTFDVLADEDTDIEEVSQSAEPSQPSSDARSPPTIKKPTKKRYTFSIVGDSMVRHLGKHTRTHIRKVVCMPGAGVTRVLGRVGEVLEEGNSTPVVSITVGTNDVGNRRTEELVTKYRQLLDKVREKGGIPVIHGILPRWGASWEWSSRALGVNSRLEKFSKECGIPFIDNWSLFYGRRSYYAHDGIHLSREGVAAVAGSLDSVFAGFR